jgi:hypothetical protein
VAIRASAAECQTHCEISWLAKRGHAVAERRYPGRDLPAPLRDSNKSQYSTSARQQRGSTNSSRTKSSTWRTGSQKRASRRVSWLAERGCALVGMGACSSNTRQCDDPTLPPPVVNYVFKKGRDWKYAAAYF